jgi:hypothetical protein
MQHQTLFYIIPEKINKFSGTLIIVLSQSENLIIKSVGLFSESLQ